MKFHLYQSLYKKQLEIKLLLHADHLFSYSSINNVLIQTRWSDIFIQHNLLFLNLNTNFKEIKWRTEENRICVTSRVTSTDRDWRIERFCRKRRKSRKTKVDSKMQHFRNLKVRNHKQRENILSQSAEHENTVNAWKRQCGPLFQCYCGGCVKLQAHQKKQTLSSFLSLEATFRPLE